jgi:hypothetical protein
MVSRYGVANAAHSHELAEKKRETLLERYGVDHPSQSADIKLKKRETMRARWGVDNPSQSLEIQQKKIKTNRQKRGVDWTPQDPNVRAAMDETNLARYGSRSSLSNSEVRHRGAKTMLEKYGSIHPQQVSEIRQRTLDTNLERYGYLYPSQSSKVKARMRETNLSRYGAAAWWSSEEGKTALAQIHLDKRGVINPAQDPAVIDKMRKTTMDRYGVTHVNYIGRDTETTSILTDPVKFRAAVSGLTVPAAATALGVNESTIYRISRDLGCRDLMDLSHNSYEKKITDLIDQIGVDYIKHDRKLIAPNELDIYIPDHRIAIEVGSIYWHGERFGRRSDYHQKKWKACSSIGVNLFQWFDSDLTDHWHLTSSRLLRALGVPSQVVGARKVCLGFCTSAEEREFLDRWHVKGYTNSRNHAIAARYRDEIVAVMSINSESGSAVIERWATDVTRSWPGLFSRCLTNWIKQQEFRGEISTWSDNRLGDGKVYLSSGFVRQHTSKPGYWYFRGQGLENRKKYQKHKLSKIFNLDPANEAMSESEIMRSQGYDRFWDAGHTLWTKIL